METKFIILGVTFIFLLCYTTLQIFKPQLTVNVTKDEESFKFNIISLAVIILICIVLKLLTN